MFIAPSHDAHALYLEAAIAMITPIRATKELGGAEWQVEALGMHAPALTVVITGIFDEEWLLEIEAVAAG
jgi:hypothetical protein